MQAAAKSRLVALILVLLLLTTTVPSTTSCEGAAGTALVVLAVVVIWVAYEFNRNLKSAELPIFIMSVDPRSGSAADRLEALTVERQDLVICNEWDSAFDVYVDGDYSCTVAALSATSVSVGVGKHMAVMRARPQPGGEQADPAVLQTEFEVLDEEGFAYAAIRCSD